MDKPITISARNLELPPLLETQVREKAEDLARFYPRLVGCSVRLEGPGKHHRRGGPYDVTIDLRVPDGEPLLITRQSGELVEVAIKEAFEAATRKLQDFARLQRGQAKRHGEAARATVDRFVGGTDYGFLRTPDDREIYFHRNAVLNDRFDDLVVGDTVTFCEEKGDEGPQATTVRLER
ncbi:MAG TPA: HPF/RaiA family ribosome-associated protein [Thermoanaerobaculia bacterium]|nr:HPF/RaiA family ribosome-associated protein [Thermoanaerobaculia bacterium]